MSDRFSSDNSSRVYNIDKAKEFYVDFLGSGAGY
jgi:hypothetical protein